MASGTLTATFAKVGENLNRYSSNGAYYAVRDAHGKLIWKSLDASGPERTGRKLAQMLEKPGRVNHATQRLTLAERLMHRESQFQQFDQGWQANETDSGYFTRPGRRFGCGMNMFNS